MCWHTQKMLCVDSHGGVLAPCASLILKTLRVQKHDEWRICARNRDFNKSTIANDSLVAGNVVQRSVGWNKNAITKSTTKLYWRQQITSLMPAHLLDWPVPKSLHAKALKTSAHPRSSAHKRSRKASKPRNAGTWPYDPVFAPLGHNLAIL